MRRSWRTLRLGPSPYVGALWQSWTMERLGNQQVLDVGLVEWRKLAQALHARYLSPDYLAAATFVSAVAEIAETEDHRPELTLAQGIVDVSLCTHEDGLWVTQKDVEMARTISEIAKVVGLKPDPASVSQLEIALDTAHEDLVSPFWSVLLTGSADNKIYDSIFDPSARVPGLWFQSTDERDSPSTLAFRPVARARGGRRPDRCGRSNRGIHRQRLWGPIVHGSRRS